jgi:hypothetical protein
MTSLSEDPGYRRAPLTAHAAFCIDECWIVLSFRESSSRVSISTMFVVSLATDSEIP